MVKFAGEWFVRMSMFPAEVARLATEPTEQPVSAEV